MDSDDSNSDVLTEAELVKDGPFDVYLVYWRKCPVGTVKRLNRIPKYHKQATDERKAEVRSQFRPNVGKWFDYWGHGLHGPFYDSKEDAARQVILRFIANPASQNSPIATAAAKGNIAEVERLIRELESSVVIDDVPPKSRRPQRSNR